MQMWFKHIGDYFLQPKFKLSSCPESTEVTMNKWGFWVRVRKDIQGWAPLGSYVVRCAAYM